ncbi:MAG: radical SAM protein, partial [Nitrospirota bacterium]
MKVCEIFKGIQGESTHAGVPCIFLRLTGCNLRCLYCDTAYAYEDGVELSEDEIVSRVAEYGTKTVEITGGEPLIQEGTRRLITRLLDSGYEVLVETNGSVDIDGVDRRAVIILDIKTPGSGMSAYNMVSNLSHLKTEDEVKFVILDRKDYEWA